MIEDTRVAYGATCTWWGLIDETATHPPLVIKGGPNLPRLRCCPLCEGGLFEIESEEIWWSEVDAHESAGNPGHRTYVEWRRGRCFPGNEAAEAAYELALEACSTPIPVATPPLATSSSLWERFKRWLVPEYALLDLAQEQGRRADQRLADAKLVRDAIDEFDPLSVVAEVVAAADERAEEMREAVVGIGQKNILADVKLMTDSLAAPDLKAFEAPVDLAESEGVTVTVSEVEMPANAQEIIEEDLKRCGAERGTMDITFLAETETGDLINDFQDKIRAWHAHGHNVLLPMAREIFGDSSRRTRAFQEEIFNEACRITAVALDGDSKELCRWHHPEIGITLWVELEGENAGQLGYEWDESPALKVAAKAAAAVRDGRPEINIAIERQKVELTKLRAIGDYAVHLARGIVQSERRLKHRAAIEEIRSEINRDVYDDVSQPPLEEE